MSLFDHPALLDEVAPYIKLESYSKDQDQTGSLRSRIEFRRLPDDLASRLLAFRKPCVACGAEMSPFRQREGSKGTGGIFFAAACPLDVNKACSRTRAASAEYERLKLWAWENRPRFAQEEADQFAEVMGFTVEAPDEAPPFQRSDGPRPAETVYFIGAYYGDTLIGIKIGKTTGPIEERVKALQTGNPYPLRVLGTTTAYFEKALHRRFESEGLAMHLEWFRPEPALLDFILKLTPTG